MLPRLATNIRYSSTKCSCEVLKSMLFCNIYVLKLKIIMQDPTEKHFGDVGILDKYKYNNQIQR
jgi:hypothetical protein